MNEAFALDHAAIIALINKAVPCNFDLVDHPTIQCSTIDGLDGSAPVVSLLGILNGLFGLTDQNRGSIEIIVDDNDTAKLLGFQVGPGAEPVAVIETRSYKVTGGRLLGRDGQDIIAVFPGIDGGTVTAVDGVMVYAYNGLIHDWKGFTP